MFKNSAKKIVSVISSIIFMITAVFTAFPVNAESYDMYYVNYSAGDVDDIVGSSTFSIAIIGGTSFEFSNSSRFSRKGYRITSWYIETTGETVSPLECYTMPYHDLDVVANWTAESYKITFAGVGGVTENGDKNTYVTATCGDIITLPEADEFTKDGYVFNGWEYDGVTYDAGDKFTVPGVVSGESIVIAATWKKQSAVTTTTTTAATTTTTTTTAATTTTNMELEEGQVVKTLEIGKELSGGDSFKTYIYKVVSKTDTIDRFILNFSADCENVGQVSFAFATTLMGGTWYQMDYAEVITGNEFSVEFADLETCNLLNPNRYFQIGFWYGDVSPVTLDSITAFVREAEVTTTTATTEETTTTTTTTTTVATTEETTTEETTVTELPVFTTVNNVEETTEETTTTTTTVATTEETTTEETTTTTVTTTETTTTTTEVTTTSEVTQATAKPSRFTDIVELNTEIKRGESLNITAENIAGTNRVIESIEVLVKSENNVDSYNIGIFMTLEDYQSIQTNMTGEMPSNTLNLPLEIEEAKQQLISRNSQFTLGYWWGVNEVITVESIKVNYRIDKGDFDDNGIVDQNDAVTLQQFMVNGNVGNANITLETADINGDGKVNVFDYMILSRNFS